MNIMDIITQKDIKNQLDTNTYLKITFRDDITDSFGDILPYPNKHFISFLNGNLYTYYWLIEGYFNTNKNYEYLNDIKSRFLITFKDKIRETKHYKTKDNINILKLKQFQKLKSISVNIINKSNRYDCTNDMVFWCLKLYCEDIIRERGICDYETLLDFGYLHLSEDIKDFSTLKSKCRSIINYYIDRDYQLTNREFLQTKEEYKMTRIENMKKQNEKKKKENTLKIKNFLSGMFVEEYKKKNGKWNISLISNHLNLSRNTIYRTLKEEKI